ncbi:MAG: PPC domain-containing DNA-binding protein [Candidatus Hodarchaeota archaeon]
MTPYYFEAGKPLLAKLPHGADLIPTLEEFSVSEKIQTAIFSIIGAVSCVTLGHYDQKLQVYVTVKKEEFLEIAHCTGNITLKDGKPTIHMHAILSNQEGRIYAGHIFSKTIIFAGEVYIQQLCGFPLEREYNENTGLFLWKGGTPWQKEL